MSRCRTTAVVAVMGIALVASGCSRSSGGSSSSRGSSTATTAAVATTTSGGDFGTLKKVCGPGTATGATAQGVTNTEIDVATMADPGNTAVPGLDKELFDTATAFMNWCDAAGGILGRKLVIHERDAKLFFVAQQMAAACGADFALVGNGEGFDSAGVTTRVKCGLPEIPAYDNSPEATEAPLKAQPNPLPIQQETSSMYLGVKHLFPNDTKAGFMVGNLAGVTTTGLRAKETAEAVGFTVPFYSLYPVTGIPNPASYVQQMKAAGVQVLMDVGSPPELVSLEKAMQTLNWYPDAIVEFTNFYDPQLTAGGAAIKNTWIEEYFYPFEMAAQNAPTQQYVNIMKADDPGGKIAALGLNAWDAWLLFAQSAAACGSNLTRSCLLQQAGSQTSWTAGGLKKPVNTSTTSRQMAQCYIYLKATATGFTPDTTFLPPTSGDAPFNCSPANVVTLKTNYVPNDIPAAPAT